MDGGAVVEVNGIALDARQGGLQGVAAAGGD